MRRWGFWVGLIAIAAIAATFVRFAFIEPDRATPAITLQNGMAQGAIPAAPQGEGKSVADAARPQKAEAVDLPSLHPLHAAMRDANPYAAYMAMLNARQKGSFAQAWFLRGACDDAMYFVAVAENSARDPQHPEPLLLERQQAINEVKSRCSVLQGARSDLNPSANDTNGAIFKAALSQLNPRAPFQEQEWKAMADQGALSLASWYLQAGPDKAQRFFEGVRIPDEASEQRIYNDALKLASLYALTGESGSPRNLGELMGCLEVLRCRPGHPEDYILAEWAADAPERAKIMALYPRMLAAMTRADAMAFAPPRNAMRVTPQP